MVVYLQKWCKNWDNKWPWFQMMQNHFPVRCGVFQAKRFSYRKMIWKMIQLGQGITKRGHQYLLDPHVSTYSVAKWWGQSWRDWPRHSCSSPSNVSWWGDPWQFNNVVVFWAKNWLRQKVRRVNEGHNRETTWIISQVIMNHATTRVLCNKVRKDDMGKSDPARKM